jgi:hypothetical protein
LPHFGLFAQGFIVNHGADSVAMFGGAKKIADAFGKEQFFLFPCCAVGVEVLDQRKKLVLGHAPFWVGVGFCIALKIQARVGQNIWQMA